MLLGFTIDSINLFIGHENIENYDYEYLKKIINAKVMKKGDSENWNEGFHKKLRIRFHENHGIYIMGSISNYYAGYTSILKYNELEKAIEKLGQELKVNLHSARLYRVDLALNIETDKSINQYTHMLFIDLPRFKRLEQADGVRFETDKIRIAIYNKKQELSDKRGVNVNMNILRIELRLLKGVSSTLGIKDMKIQDLYNPVNCKKLVKKFQEYYLKIKKQSIPKEFHEFNRVTPSIYSDLIKRRNIISEKDAYREIEQLSIEGKFKTANEKSRCKNQIKKLSNNKIISKIHPLAEEINNKVDSECERFLVSIFK